MRSIDEAPAELAVSIQEFFPQYAWDEAASIAWLESQWNAFALYDSTSADIPCGAALPPRDGVGITAERSVGYFQINACNFPGWEWQRFYNARHNVGTAHLLWDRAGRLWTPWYFSAKRLGLR